MDEHNLIYNCFIILIDLVLQYVLYFILLIHSWLNLELLILQKEELSPWQLGIDIVIPKSLSLSLSLRTALVSSQLEEFLDSMGNECNEKTLRQIKAKEFFYQV